MRSVSRFSKFLSGTQFLFALSRYRGRRSNKLTYPFAVPKASFLQDNLERKGLPNVWLHFKCISIFLFCKIKRVIWQNYISPELPDFNREKDVKFET